MTIDEFYDRVKDLCNTGTIYDKHYLEDLYYRVYNGGYNDGIIDGNKSGFEVRNNNEIN